MVSRSPPRPLRCVEDINPGFCTAAGRPKTLLLNLFRHDVNFAAGGHVDLNLTLPTHV